MNRLIYLAIIIGVIVLGLLAGFYLRYQSAPAPTPTSETSGTNTGGLPPVSGTGSGVGTNAGAGSNTGISGTSAGAGSGASAGSQPQVQNFGVISENQALAYFIDASNAATIVTPEGKIIKVSAGTNTTLSDAAIPNIFGASFSFDGKYALLLSGNQDSPTASIFNTSGRTSRALTIHPVGAAWSPTKDQFAYLGSKSNGNPVKTLDATNAKSVPAALFSFNALDLALSWTDDRHILITQRPSNLVAGSAWLYDIQKRTFSSLAENQGGLMVNWDGAKNMGLLFTSGRGNALSFVDQNAGVTKNLSFLTLPQKCAFDNTAAPASSTVLMPVLYCAIPRTDDADFRSASLPDDYLMSAIYTVDDLVSIDLTSGNISAVWHDTNIAVDATDLRIVNGRIFFINRYDRKLYAATLGK